MRTATPLVTWSMITEYGAVGDVARDLEAAVDRPGMQDDDVGRLRERGRRLGQAVVARVLVEAREEVAPMPLALDAQHHDRRRRRGRRRAGRVDLGPERGELAREQRRRTDQPDASRRARAARAGSSAPTRLCSRSPTIATVRPARRPRRSRIVSRSSSACVGCSWQPSPALMIGHVDVAREQVRRARGVVADDDRIGPHGLEVARRVERASRPWSRSMVDAAMLIVVGAESRLAAISNDVRVRVLVLVEEVDDRLAAQRRHLLDVALRDLLEGCRRVEQRR